VGQNGNLEMVPAVIVGMKALVTTDLFHKGKRCLAACLTWPTRQLALCSQAARIAAAV